MKHFRILCFSLLMLIGISKVISCPLPPSPTVDLSITSSNGNLLCNGSNTVLNANLNDFYNRFFSEFDSSSLAEVLAYSPGHYGPNGGKVIYDKGTEENGWRYLQLSPFDITIPESILAGFGCDCQFVNANGDAAGAGFDNFNAWLSSPCASELLNYIDTLHILGFDDWYIPSPEELLIAINSPTFFNNENAFLSLSTDNYWTSLSASFGACDNNGGVYQLSLPSGTLNSVSRNNTQGKIRLVRRFSNSPKYTWNNGATGESLDLSDLLPGNYLYQVNTTFFIPAERYYASCVYNFPSYLFDYYAININDTAEISITVFDSQTFTDTIDVSACSSYAWKGDTYTQSGTYTWTGTNAAGCDSLVTLNLTITPQPEQPQLACWQTATFNAESCSWVISGTQPAEPTNLACYESAVFNSNICEWEITGTQPANWYLGGGTVPPPPLPCNASFFFNDVTCEWEVTGSPAPAIVTNASACESYTWEVNGQTYSASGNYSFSSNCQDYTLNLTIAPQPPQPPTACYQTATFNTQTCAWDVTGTQPTQPATACYQTATFNSQTCAWVLTGAQPAQPPTACYQTATFNTQTCSWDVTGTQPTQPATACYQTATFNNQSCAWVLTGTQPTQPATACYQTATFNNQSCAWVLTGTQPTQPATACYETAAFNPASCSWDVTGSPVPAIVTNASACGSYTWEANGQTYTSSGNYTYSENCVNSVLNLTINQATASTINASINQGESYSFNGQNLTTAGTFTATLQNAAGCDSVVTLNLTVNAAPQICDVTVSDTEICAGESVSISVGGVTPSPGGCSSANMPANLQQGLVAWYPFCGNAEDESPNDYNGTVRNAVLTTDRFGNANQAYSFTTGQDIIVNGTQGLNLYPMSISLWYNVDTIVSIYDEANIFSKYSPAAWNGYAIITSNMAPEEGNVYYPTVKPWYTRSINNRIIGRYGSAPFEHENIDLDAWHHMVFTVAPDGGKCYVNGQLIATDIWDGAAGPSSSSFIWKIGGLYDYWYNGKIDDIAVYNRVLTAAEATQLYQYQAQSETTSILWSNGEATPTINVSPSETTTYTVTVNQGTQTCTSDVTIMVNQPSATSETASACNSYTWNGSTYTQSGTYTWTGNNVAGCDSVVTLNLTITPQPAQPSTACYQTATFNNQTCSWVLSGTQPAQPPTACYQTATFNDQTCSWDVTGTQPAQPATACYQTATFNNQTCSWVLTGTQPTQPATACYETASFNALSCSWVVTGSPAPAIVTNASACESYTWEVNGQTYTTSGNYSFSSNCQDYTLNLTIAPQPPQPPTACYQTATFNNQTCSWVLSGTQPAQPPTACYQTATFNDQTCSWDVTGTQPAQPATACYQTATFNNQSCAWVLTGTQPTQPATACYETASFNALSCSWVVTGTPAPAIVTNASACGSYTWEANGQTYTTSGNYSFSSNCQDYTLNLTINQASTSTVNATITQGESYSFNGQNLTTAGTYFDTLQNVAGCDLYVTLNLTVNPAPVAGCYATSVVNFTQGQRADATNVIAIRSNATQALGMPEPVVNNVVNFVSLGFGGSITLAFETPIANGAGNDIRIDEATWGNNTCNNYPEKADVFASQDGTNFIYLGRACHDASFDLGVMSWAKYIRVVDVSNTLSFTSDADGFDVNGIECLNGASINPTDDGLQACTLQEIVSYTPANRKNGTAVPAPRNNANNALGAPQSNNTINFVSLGFGGTLVAKFDFVVFNQAGNDLRVTETSFGNPSCSSYPERARVSVSLDGNSWSELGEICLDGSLDFGTVPYAQYIRITDSSPLSSSRFNGSADGFDVDAVVVLNNGCGSSSARFAELDNTTTPDASMTISAFPNPMEDYTIVNFDGLEIETDFNFQIMDAAGRLIRNENIRVSPENPTYLFTATELARGIYQIVISNKNDNQVIRLVK